MCLYHSSIKEVCRFFILHNAKCRLQNIQPLVQRPKFDILNRTWRSNQFNILDPCRTCSSIKLLNICDIIVLKPFLNVRVKTTGLKKSTTQQEHPMFSGIWHSSSLLFLKFQEHTSIHQ